MKQEIAQRLAARRKRAGLSQESLAEQLGVSRQAMSKWECGECAPDTENLIALAVLYDVSLDDLLWKDLEPEGEEAAAVDAIGDAGRASKGTFDDRGASYSEAPKGAAEAADAATAVADAAPDADATPGADEDAQSDWFAARDGSGHTFETDGSTVVVDGVRYDSWRTPTAPTATAATMGDGCGGAFPSRCW